MLRWNSSKGKNIENQKIDAFLKDILDVCERHGLSIAHEDRHGAFEIERISEDNKVWLMDAHDDTDKTT